SENVGQIHGEWVRRFFPQAKRGRGSNRGDNRVAMVKGGEEILPEERTYLLGFQIIGIIVTSREYVRSEENPSFDLRTESLGTGMGVYGHEGRGVGSTGGIFDAVVAREVRAGFCGRNNVVRGDSIVRMRQRNADGLYAEPFQMRHRVADRGFNLRLHPFD